MTISRAVASSSNFPVAFAPLTFNNYNNHCGALPDWVEPAQDPRKNPKRRVAEANSAKSYHDPNRHYLHLLDGGLSDNLGLRGPFQAITSTDSPWSILSRQANLRQFNKIIVISVNAKTTKHHSWDTKSTPPSIMDVLRVVTSGPMDDVSLDSIDITEGHFKYMEQLSRSVNSCNDRIANSCPEAPRIVNPITTDFTFAELTFDNIPDVSLRKCLQELPTSFSLSIPTVDLLRQSAGYLLMHSNEFIDGMQRLDSTWTPQEVSIDRELIEKVCGEGIN